MPRCSTCGLHTWMCLCRDIEPLLTRTRVVVLMHHKEAQKSSNSGRLVPLALRNGEVRIRGIRDLPLDTTGLNDPARLSLLLYPVGDAEVLDPAKIAANGRPVTLFVPDGNWRQARKVAVREPALRDLPRVKLPPGPPSKYRLRSHPEADRISTFEAVARAIGVLEGPEVQARLDYIFAQFVDRALWARGDIAAAEVTGGLPERPK